MVTKKHYFHLRLTAIVFTLALGLLCPCDFTGSRLSAQQGAGAPLVRVDSIAIDGNYRLSEITILGTLGFQAGAEVTHREIQNGIKSLYSTGQFEDVVVRAVGNAGEPVLLIIEVSERDVVRRITIAGLEHASENTVRDTTGLRAGQPYSPSRILAAKDFIRSELIKDGIPFARIEERTEPVPDQQGEIYLFLDVTEGNRVTISEFAVSGNAGVSAEDIQNVMRTKPEGFWWFRNGNYDIDRFQQDLEVSIPGLYRSKGYLDFEVVSDSLVVDPQSGKSRMEILVDEGPRFQMSEFSVTGNRHFSTDQVESHFNARSGGLLSSLGFGGDDEEEEEYFDGQAFDNARMALEQAYQNEGYLYAQVSPWIERLEGEEGAAPTVDVGWQIREGNPAYVNRIDIEGNDFTYERVIRERIFMLPGDVYSMERLLNSWQGLGSLGFFETPLPEPGIVPDEQTGDVDITFGVQERQTGSINFGTAVGGGTGVSGFLGYDQPNLFGQAKEGHLRWDFGRYINSFTLTFTNPSIKESMVSGTISLFSSRDRFFQFRTGRRKRTGFSVRFGVPIPWSVRTRVFAGYSLAQTDYRLYQDVDDSSLFGLPPGTQSTFSLGITRNTLNHPIFPVSGSSQSLNSEFNGGLLGGDGNFIKHSASATWWVPAGSFGGGAAPGGGVRLALGLKIETGAIFGNVDRFPFDRFWMGGVQFGQNLRGYDETTITPVGYYPERSSDLSDIQRLGNAYVSISAEYAARLNDNMSFSFFYDAGNIWADALDVDPTRLFRGAGLGIQLVTPFGPIGLDYAYGFDKAEPGWQLHFRMGPGY